MSDRIETHYHATAAPVAFDEALPTETETLVIGGGLAGLTVAEGLAQRRRAVTVIEARTVGIGASGRNGGFVSPGFAESLGAIARRVGKDEARALFDLSKAGAQRVRQTIEAVGLPDIIAGQGWLKVVRHGDGSDLRRAREARARDFGHDLQFVDRADLAGYVMSDRYRAALLDPDAFHIHPLAYARALAERARDAGAIIVERSAALNLAREGGVWRVHTEQGSVSARHVVLAGSAYQHGLWPPLERAVLPVATYVVTSEPATELLARAILFAGCIADTRRAGDYYRLLPEPSGKRLLWGGRITTRTTVPPHLIEALRQDIVGVYPQLRNLKLERAWVGLMGYTRLKMPLIGELETGLWACTAFGGHGLNTTAMGGDLIASAIAENDDTWRRFLPFHTRWGGGWPGRITAQGAYWAMQARDWLDEAWG